MKRMILAATVAALLTGCGSLSGLSTAKIEFTDGTNKWSIVQPKKVTLQDLKVNPKTGEFSVKRYTSSPSAEAVHAQADLEKARFEANAATFNNGFNAAVNGLKVYTGQGATVQNQPIAITQDQIDEAVRRNMIRQSNSTAATVTEVKPK